MSDTETNEEARLRELAQQLGCLTEAEHLLLSGWAPATAKSKRKRGEGPPYVRHGRHYLYPRAQYEQYLASRTRGANRTSAKSLL